jgi:2-aminoadipate transaminase
MQSKSIDYAQLLRRGLPPPAVRWTGLARYNFTGGNNDADAVPVDDLIVAATTALEREGRSLATYGLASGPQGHRRLREFLAFKLRRDAGLLCQSEDILLTSGSLQALDLINGVLLEAGDTVIVEQETYGGALTRFNRLRVTTMGIPLDGEGLRTDLLESALADLKRRGVRPKYIYTIPTVQNPSGTIMGVQRRQQLLDLAGRYDVPIVEDDCYADLVWDGRRPPAIYAMSERGDVIHVGSFSKSIAPALRVGFVVAPWEVLSRMLSLKTDAGSGALEQMLLAEYCDAHFEAHVPVLRGALRLKLDALVAALEESFGTSAEFEYPKGGIFLWVKLPDGVDTRKLFHAALAEGVAINPGPEWSTDASYAASRMRLCFASPSADEIRRGVAVLAEVCGREFGVPQRIANIASRGS